MAIRDALHRHDLMVSWLIARGAADDLHHHDNDVTGTGPDCTSVPARSDPPEALATMLCRFQLNDQS